LTELSHFEKSKMAATAILDFRFYFPFRVFKMYGKIKCICVQNLVQIGSIAMKWRPKTCIQDGGGGHLEFR
jgi:hypothetical protein